MLFNLVEAFVLQIPALAYIIANVYQSDEIDNNIFSSFLLRTLNNNVAACIFCGVFKDENHRKHILTAENLLVTILSLCNSSHYCLKIKNVEQLNRSRIIINGSNAVNYILLPLILNSHFVHAKDYFLNLRWYDVALNFILYLNNCDDSEIKQDLVEFSQYQTVNEKIIYKPLWVFFAYCYFKTIIDLNEFVSNFFMNKPTQITKNQLTIINKVLMLRNYIFKLFSRISPRTPKLEHQRLADYKEEIDKELYLMDENGHYLYCHCITKLKYYIPEIIAINFSRSRCTISFFSLYLLTLNM